VKIDIVSIFPEYFAPLELSLVGRARSLGLLTIAVHDLRSWTTDVHRTVDDTPYGGGPGMVMRPEPWGAALDALVPSEGAALDALVPSEGTALDVLAAPESACGVRLVVPTPAGQPFTQALAHEFAAGQRLLFACGRYEGIDQRVLDHASDRMPVSEVSLGDYVLFGGEVAVIAMIEAVTRLIPGVLGNADSLVEESHAAGVLEAPMYTKPALWRDLAVPEVLRSGDHGKIARWRRDQSLLRTAERRPDLLARLAPETLDKRDVAALLGGGFQLSDLDVAE
jgi:tRNA (guanine37-N1)-methyltransferase